MKYPKGTRFTEWYLFKEKDKESVFYRIRREVIYPSGSRKKERLPIKKYKSLRKDPKELEQFVIRLNTEVPEEQRIKKVVEIRHAYISPDLLDSYKEYLKAQIPNQERASFEFGQLRDYFLNYFINIKQIVNPVDWHKIHETDWAIYLVGPDVPKSANYKKQIISAANRFILWLHKKRPEEIPPLKFQPLTKPKFKEIEAKRELAGEIHQPQFIKDKDWKIITEKLPDSISPYVKLAYSYGLRRSETLGLTLSDVRKDYLLVQKQLRAIPNNKPDYAPLKDRQTRKVPHWFATAKQSYEWIQSLILMHPDTLTDKWNEYIREDLKKHNFTYTFHDLRHTYITKSVKIHHIEEVRKAVGHEDIQTTMGYVQDDRELNDDPYIPD